MNERDAFGEFRPTKEFIAAYRAKARDSGYVGYEPMLDLIRRYGANDPLNPEKPFAKELRQAVIEELGLEQSKDMDRVRLYTAIGTAADVFHGIDSWIEYETDDGRRIVVTLDLTENPNKDACKADVMIPEEIPDEEDDRFLDIAAKYGTEVVEHMQDQLRQLAA